MASPQKENGFTQISNELIEAFQKLHLSGNQGQIMWTIIRKTYGWHKDVASISLTTFEEGTGIDRSSLCRCLDAMAEKKIITKDNTGNITKYGIQKDYTKWVASVKITTSGKNDTTTSVNNDTETSGKNATHKRKKETKASPNPDGIRMSELLFNLIQERNPNHKKPDMQKWALHIDNMIRLDNRSVEDIEKIIRWCQEDEFWQNNILSTGSLRKQYDTLWLKAGLNGKQNFKRFDEQGF